MRKMTTWMIACLTIINTTRAFPYQVRSMDTNGFIIENLASISMYDLSWKIVAYINLTDYMSELGKINCYTKQVEELCDLLGTHRSKSCNLIPEQLDLIMKDANSLGGLLPIKQSASRKKRALLEFIGEIQSSLFGTLAASDGRFYNEQIQRLAANQIQQQDLIKKQTTVLKSSIETQTVAVRAQIAQGKIFQSKMIQLSDSLRQLTGKMNNEFQVIEQVQQVDELITYTILMAQRCKEKLIHLTQALTSKHGGPSIPTLVRPETLWRELKDIENRKHSDTSLPTELTRETLFQYYTIGSPKIGISDGLLIIKFEIPLVNAQKFTIQKITPVPIKIGEGLFSILVPEHELIALSEDNKSFADIAEQELGHCVKVPNKGYACPDLPIFQTEMNPSCDLAILTNNTQLMKSCQTRVLKIQNELWLTLLSRFSWVFTVNAPTSATITTEDNKKYYTTLKDSGVLTLESGASLRTEAVKVSAPVHESMDLEVKFMASNNTPVYKFDPSKDIKIDIPTAPQLIKLATLEKLKKITRDIKEIQELEKKPLLEMLTKNESGIKYYTSLVGGVVMGLIALYLIWRFRCCSILRCCCNVCKRSKKDTGRKGRRPEIEIIHMPEIKGKHDTNLQGIHDDTYEVPIKIKHNELEKQRSPRTQPPAVPRNNKIATHPLEILREEDYQLGNIV